MDGRRHRRCGAAPVRPLRRDDGHRDGRDRDPRARSPTRASSGATSSSRSAGSYEVDNPDAVVALLGLTGIPFTDVYNGCATAASALHARGQHDPARRARPRHRGRHGQAPARRVQRRPASLRVPVVVRRGRAVHHDEVLRDEDQQVHARPRHLARDARQGRGEELPQRRAATRTRSGASRSPRRRSSASPMLNYPLTQYMFCSPDEGAAAVVLCQAEHAHRYTDTPIYLRATTRAHAPARRVRGAQPVAADRGDGGADGRRVARRVRDGRASAPKTST